ncbi:MAG: hypothetical protein GY841_16135 [FCB group bacterium]|nr:hypothetical protein [FCB group bacterium]
MKIKLWAPAAYWRMTREEIEKIAHGCGPGSGWAEKVVPDFLLWVSVRPACEIHDVMYHFGETEDDRREADETFRNNMLRIVRARTRSGILRSMRSAAAWLYFYAVSWGGGPAFWNDKNSEREYRTVEV